MFIVSLNNPYCISESSVAALGKTTYNITKATGSDFVIRNRSFLLTDGQGKELLDDGMQLFDIAVNSGDIHQFAAGYIPSHWHKELEVFVLLEGQIQIGIGDGTYRLQAGDGCFINTEVIHSFTADVPSPCRYRSFVFNPDIVGGMPGSVFDAAYVRPLLENGASFLKFQEEEDRVYFERFHRAYLLYEEEGYGYEFRVRDALSDILLHAKSKSTSAAGRAIPSLQETRLKEMLIWIDRNLEKNITVSQISAAANICTRECQRIFSQYLHYSPVEYVQKKRVIYGAKQLTDTDIPITQVALNCGFSNPSYFAKRFKEFMGSTPGEYRGAVREKR